jgi:hypothetical protein
MGGTFGRDTGGTRARGQALLEAALTLPLLVLFGLGGLQLVVLAHARVMTRYAAFCAARAGLVHDADWVALRNAALVATLPLYRRTDTTAALTRTWAEVRAAAELGHQLDEGVATLGRLGERLLGVDLSALAPDVGLVEVRVTSPTRADFEAWEDWVRARSVADPRLAYPEAGRELDFDDAAFEAAHPGAGRLAVEVRVLFPLRLPLVGRLVFETWLARAELALAPRWRLEVGLLRELARRAGVYLVPLTASWAMPMQSSPYRASLREPVWLDEAR